jgi:hypothetical protein
MTTRKRLAECIAGRARIAVLVALLAPMLSFADTLHVETSGNDDSSCGSRASPCRTIAAGISHASPGDDVLVGPGTYGDLDDDGDFDDAGEEPVEAGSGCECIVRLDRRIRLASSDGAAATTITAGTARVDLVAISANGATFGALGAGFSLDRGETAVNVKRETRNVHVRDNAAKDQRRTAFIVRGIGHAFERNSSERANRAFLVTGQGHVLASNQAIAPRYGALGIRIAGKGHRFVDNRVVDADLVVFGSAHEIVGNTFERSDVTSSLGAQLVVTGNSLVEGSLDLFGSNLIADNELNGGNGLNIVGNDNHVLRNRVTGSAYDYALRIAGRRNTIEDNVAELGAGDGFNIQGGDNVLRHNRAERNGGVGFGLFYSPTVRALGNRAIDNVAQGFLIDHASATLMNNEISGNGLAGVENRTRDVSMHRNDIVGNDGERNCGVRTKSGAFTDARNTWWGGGTGPGPDPADNVCGGGETVFEPFAATPIHDPTRAK